MRLILSLVALTSPALAALNGHCSGTATGNFKNSGICINTNTCRSFGGNDITGGCPSDPTATRCRVVGLYPNEANNPCGGISYCDWTANGCAGSWVSGMYSLVDSDSRPTN